MSWALRMSSVPSSTSCVNGLGKSVCLCVCTRQSGHVTRTSSARTEAHDRPTDARTSSALTVSSGERITAVKGTCRCRLSFPWLFLWLPPISPCRLLVLLLRPNPPPAFPCPCAWWLRGDSHDAAVPEAEAEAGEAEEGTTPTVVWAFAKGGGPGVWAGFLSVTSRGMSRCSSSIKFLARNTRPGGGLEGWG